MSVEKVNKYKENKKNRKQLIEKEKKKKKLHRIGGTVAGLLIALAIVFLIALTGKNSYDKYVASKPDYTRDSMVVKDMTNILSELETEEAESSKADK